jgi:hypothetical protein
MKAGKLIIYTLLLAIIVCWLNCSLMQKPLDRGDDAEWYGEALERATLTTIFDPIYDSGRPGPSSYYQPVQTMIWRAIQADYGDSPPPYRILSMFLHFLSSLTVLIVSHHLLKRELTSLLAAISFAVYYPHYHTVAWASAGITHGLSALLAYLVLYLIMRYYSSKKRGFYLASLLIFILGLFTKQAVFTFLVPVIIAYYLLFERGWGRRLKPGDKTLLPYMALPVPFILLELLIKGGDSAVVKNWGGMNFGIHMLYRLMDYVGFMITGYPVASGVKLILAYSLLLLIPTTIQRCRKDKTLAFLIIWLVITLSMFTFSNFRDIYGLGRYLYIASAPWLMIIYHLAGTAKTHKKLAYATAVSYTIILNLALAIA